MNTKVVNINDSQCKYLLCDVGCDQLRYRGGSDRAGHDSPPEPAPHDPHLAHHDHHHARHLVTKSSTMPGPGTSDTSLDELSCRCSQHEHYISLCFTC